MHYGATCDVRLTVSRVEGFGLMLELKSVSMSCEQNLNAQSYVRES